MPDRLPLVLCVPPDLRRSRMRPAPPLGRQLHHCPLPHDVDDYGEVGRIEGEVRDLGRQSPIGNLELRLADLDRRQRTNGQGSFRFDSSSGWRHVLLTEGSVYQARGTRWCCRPTAG